MFLPRKRRKRRSARIAWLEAVVLLFLCFLVVGVHQADASVDPYSGLVEEDDPPPPPPQSASKRSRNVVELNVEADEEDFPDEVSISSSTKLRKSASGPSRTYRSDATSSFSSSAAAQDSNSETSTSLGGSESLFIHIIPHSHVDHGWLQTADASEEAVQTILSSVTQQLDLDVKRKFVWAEVWYFRRWFESLSSSKREKVKRLVKEGRFEFVGGGLVMHDESLSSQRLMIEQIQEGHAFLEQVFGIPSPKIAWQVDSIGHSDATPGILSRLGYSVVVLNRVHFRIKQRFRKGQHLEFVWRGPRSGSPDAFRASNSKDSKAIDRENADEAHQIFAHLLPVSYSAPEGSDFEKSGTRQVTAPRGRATKFLQYARELSRAFRTHHVMIPWGDDFRFREADKQFANMDKIIAEIAAENPTVRIQYSTPSEYFDSLQRAAASSSLRFPLYLGDFQPFADSGDAYWSGVYSSRSGLKRWARQLESKVFAAGTMFSLARAKAALYGNVPRVASIETESGRVVPDDARPAASWGVGLHRTLLFAKRQAILVGTHHHSITGSAKEQVIKDFLKRAKSAYESAARVSAEALSFLVSKRRIDFKSAGPHVRPPLKPWTSSDALDIKDDGRQWPIIFSNDGGHWRREVAAVRLVCPWATAKRTKVVDGQGNAVPSQIHKSLASSNDGDEGGWKTDTYLFMFIEVPPLGFATYFVSSSTNAERLASAAQQTTAALVQVQVFDMSNGRIMPFVSGDKEATEGIKVMTTTPGNAPESRTNEAGACLVIDNDALSLEMDCETSLIKAVTDKRTKKRVLLRQEFRVHESSRGGVNLFRPDRLESTLLQVGGRGRLTAAIVRGPLVQEVQILADGLSQTVRLIRAPHGLDSNSALALEGHVFASHAIAGTTPDVDVVVRYSTDLKTSGIFYTDNPSGALRERKGQMDAPLAANFYPCSSTLMLKSAATAFGIVTSQPVGCTGAASIAAGGGEIGIVEVVLHRNPTADDGRGLGEGLLDFGVARLESFLFLDQIEAAISRRPNLGSRMSLVGDLNAAQLDYTSLLSPFLSREAWASRFLTSGTWLKKNALPSGVRLLSLFPRDEMSDEVLARVEYLGDATTKLDWADIFNAEELIVAGLKEMSKPDTSAPNSLSFQCSDRPDDFHGAGLDLDPGATATGYQLSEHALKHLNGDTDDMTSAAANKAQSSSTRKLSMGSKTGESQGPSGGLLPSSPILDAKWNSFVLPFELRRGDNRVFSLNLLALPDEKVSKRASTSASSNADVKRKLTLPPQSSPGNTDPPTIPLTQTSRQASENNRVKRSALSDADNILNGNPPAKATADSHSSHTFPTESISIPKDQSVSAAALRSATAMDHKGKSLSNLRSELIAEEKRSAALEIRSKRLQQNVDELLQELELFQDIDGGLDKKAALEELTRAEEQLVEGNMLLAESKEKVLGLQRELDHHEALDELRNRHPHSRRRGGDSLERGESSGTLHGFFAGAGGMLVVIIAAQWFLTGRRRHQQAYVPVRYVPVNHSGANFALPVKRL